MPPKNMLSIKDKIDIINVIEREKLTVREIAKRFNIGKTQAAEIKKNTETIRTKWKSGVNVHQKRDFIKAGGIEIDRMCLHWFTKARSQNIKTTGPMIKAKAREIAAKLGISEFSASDGWLHKWRKRNNISFKCKTDEASNGDPTESQQFKDNLITFLREYKPEDVYNADAIELFYPELPDLAPKPEITREQFSKERFTVLFCANLAGEKEHLLVIGKGCFTCPRVFKDLIKHQGFVDWKSNQKASMTREIMTGWLQHFDEKMRSQQRQILLFLDNAEYHPRELNLTNIKLVFLPATTAVSQPLEQGVIQNFKVHYRDLSLKKLLSKVDGESPALEQTKTMNVLEALNAIKTSWDKVEATTIQRGFLKAGFSEDDEDSVAEIDREGDIPWVQNESLQEEFPQSVDDFLKVECTEDDCNEILKGSDITERYKFEEEVDMDVELPDSINSYEEALKQIARLKHFARDDFVGLQHIQNLENYFESQQLKLEQSMSKQPTIDRFLQRQ